MRAVLWRRAWWGIGSRLIRRLFVVPPLLELAGAVVGDVVAILTSSVRAALQASPLQQRSVEHRRDVLFVAGGRTGGTQVGGRILHGVLVASHRQQVARI